MATKRSLNAEPIANAYFDGYITAALTARYHELRVEETDALIINAPDPRLPEVVDEILGSMCRDCIRSVAEHGWYYFDGLLRCSTREEVKAALDSQPDLVH